MTSRNRPKALWPVGREGADGSLSFLHDHESHEEGQDGGPREAHGKDIE